MYHLLEFGFFVMAGEELSWGQRLFNMDTLKLLQVANVQSEMNLSNLFGYFADHLFIAIALIFGFILPIIAHYNVFFQRFLDIIGLPVASMGLTIGIVIISLIHNWTVYNVFKALPHLEIDELR